MNEVIIIIIIIIKGIYIAQVRKGHKCVTHVNPIAGFKGAAPTKPFIFFFSLKIDAYERL